MNEPVPIPVVCAVIECNGLLLLAQRPADKHLPLKWEFPGGKVEPGETPAAAIVREIQEELGCEVVVTRALPRTIHRYERALIEMIPFVCQLTAGTAAPQAREHIDLAWVKAAALLDYDLAAADLPVVKNYRAG